VGRQTQLARLAALVDTVSAHGQVLLVLGAQGMGASTLLADAADRASAAGLRVLRATGRESETRLAFAGLHQLLKPVIGATAGLPKHQAQALLGALGLAAEPAAADPLVTGIAALTLLSDASETAPVLLVIDDAHWLDRSSLDVLAFVAGRLDTERVSLLLSARGQVPPAGFDRGFPELWLEPLSRADAGRLLDAQPQPPRGRARAQVLAQAAGNPMALIELATVIAADPAAGRRWAEEPLPPGDRLAAVITARFAALPESAQAALLLAAVADGADLTGAASGGAGLEARALASAEQQGLVTIDRTGLRFSHPLIRSAVYHGAPFAQRAAAHRRLAAALDQQPDRRAWHLAAAALHPDEQVASLLEATAGDARRRGGAVAAALAMERAAELSPAPGDQARRLVDAASSAVTAGQGDWVGNLTARALAIATDPELRLRARGAAGWALAYAGRRSAAFTELIAVAEESAADHPALAWEALADAATVAYQAGTPASRQAVSHALRLLENRDPPLRDHRPDPAAPIDAPIDAQLDVRPRKLWILACTAPLGADPTSIGLAGTDPTGADQVGGDSAGIDSTGTGPAGAGQLVPYLRQLAGTAMDDAALWRVGSAAWLLDESKVALRLLQSAMDRLRAPGMRGASGGGLTALGWLYLDTGRWDEALEAAAEAADLAEANHMVMVAASADAITATVLALRGDSGAARRHAENTLARVDPAESGLIASRAWRALGVAALAEGDHLLAFTQLGLLFGADGVPVHNIFSYLGVADIAAAAIRADQRSQGQAILDRALAQLGGTPSPRLRQLIARARGTLADQASAGAHLATALRDPAGDQWPFERAQLRLDYAEWLRRRRRINEAKPQLVAALDTFRRLGARSSVERAEGELRASGIAVADTPGAPDPLAGLTPQQRQIVRLAGDGLTNREIGDRLLLSPRTVGSHLYRTFPKLGITDRHQLRDVIAGTDA
jgi:DNA-binding CsgD family transcriptional regulator/tetratricopeptide (TPR) repeat protein